MRLDQSKDLWKVKLPGILWAYHCSPQTNTKETSFHLTYGTNDMIHVEVMEPSMTRLFLELETRDGVHEMARIKEEATKL